MRVPWILASIFVLIGCSHSQEKTSVPTLTEGQKFTQVSFKDQFEKEVMISDTTVWVLFSKEKEVNTMINVALKNKPNFVSSGGVYVADISAMPGIITSLFALPKMRKYPYSVALDRTGRDTQTWPFQEGSATLFKLNRGKIEKIIFVKSPDELVSLIK